MNIQYAYSDALCSCPNQHLLTPGMICEFCSGITPETELEHENESKYDAAWFEELDAYYGDVEYAA